MNEPEVPSAAYLVALLPLLVALGLVIATSLVSGRAERTRRRQQRIARAKPAKATTSEPRQRAQPMGAGAVAPPGAADAGPAVDADTAAQIRALMDAARAKLAEGDGDGAIACALAAASVLHP